MNIDIHKLINKFKNLNNDYANFNFNDYLDVNPYLKKNIKTEYDALNHYLSHGKYTNLIAKINDSEFDLFKYRVMNPDLDKLTDGQLKHHYVTKKELTKTTYNLPQSFDWKKYLILNPDLQKNGINNELLAIRHYIMHGINEKRQYTYNLPSSFNWKKYLELNPDLHKNGINNEALSIKHFILHGLNEKRKY
jgi:hypothetical protein